MNVDSSAYVSQQSADLITDYARASRMLQPSIYPVAAKKTEHLKAHSPHNFRKLPLTTFFEKKRNSVGITIQENKGTGNECTGLNDGSKNTVATTYLADAFMWGAEIFCGCKIQFVEPNPEGGYIIHFARYGMGREEFKDEFKHQLFWIKAVGIPFSIIPPKQKF